MLYVGMNPREIVTDSQVTTLILSRPKQLSAEEAEELIRLDPDFQSCFELHHQPILDIVKRRLGLEFRVPALPGRYEVRKGDKFIIIKVANIRQLIEGEVHDHVELRKARHFLILYTVM